MPTDELTCVSGYWPVKNKHGDAFNNWFANTLNVDHPYVIFGAEPQPLVQQARAAFPTTYETLSLADCYLSPNRDRVWTHDSHCPSPELNIVWNEKVFLLQRAVERNHYASEWFMWIDAGICSWRTREQAQPLRLDRSVLATLPKTQFIFAASTPRPFEKQYVSAAAYYHYISGTAFLMHQSMVPFFCDLCAQCLDLLIKHGAVFTDQIMYTHIYSQYPDLFFKLADGYGGVATTLFPEGET